MFIFIPQNLQNKKIKKGSRHRTWENPYILAQNKYNIMYDKTLTTILALFHCIAIIHACKTPCSTITSLTYEMRKHRKAIPTEQ